MGTAGGPSEPSGAGVSSLSSDAVVLDEAELDASLDEIYETRMSAEALVDQLYALSFFVAHGASLFASSWPVLLPGSNERIYTVSNFDGADLVTTRALTTDASLHNPDPALVVPLRSIHAYHTRAAAARLAAYQAALLAGAQPPDLPAHGPEKRQAEALPVSSMRPSKRSKPDSEDNDRGFAPTTAHSNSAGRALSVSRQPAEITKTKRRTSQRRPRKKKARAPDDTLRVPSIDYVTGVHSGASDTKRAATVPAAVDESSSYIPVPFDLSLLTFDPTLAAAARAASADAPRLRPLLMGKAHGGSSPPVLRPSHTARLQSHNAARPTAVVQPASRRAPSSADDAPSAPRTSPIAATPSDAAKLELLNKSKTGHGGHIPRTRIRHLLAVWGTPAIVPLLERMQVVPENDIDTAVCDRNGRCIVFRTPAYLGQKGEDLMARLCADVRKFTKHTRIGDSDRTANSRGHHYAGCMGVHRQYTAHAKETVFHRKHTFQVDWLMRPNGPLAAYLKILNGVMKSRFGALYDRMKACVDWHVEDCAQRGQPINPHFSPWMNCCVNAPSPEVGVHRVTTRPHGDTRNVGTFYCALLAYWDDGWVGEDEWSYVVFWELGIIMACPRGAWVLYPSALLLHFNVRIVKCKKGKMPTPRNTQEMPNASKSRRGSIVLFTQSTMISVTDEKERDSRLATYEAAVSTCFPPMPEAESLLDGLD
ncbi:hypothetical protein EXIGLDRAFT_765264 [Exidia glandulosa HHB12029]|uniref:Uncharacterized protein n=1 Tax=Exidia glandulosa HHB12029 TaxID=1314781 RepID=A0A165KJX4_EXIGL|nr:hypothetical protein EXIGLDRAFT_765264 [Exidia glandulosa HHB12029]